jgi:hypothetical protein
MFPLPLGLRTNLALSEGVEMDHGKSSSMVLLDGRDASVNPRARPTLSRLAGFKKGMLREATVI